MINQTKNIKLSILVAITLIVLFPIFSIAGNSFLFNTFVVFHLLSLLILNWHAVKMLLNRDFANTDSTNIGSTNIGSINIGSATKYNRLVIILIFLILLVLASRIILPVTARDALIHHLALPKWWLEANSPLIIPWHSWSFYPASVQTLYISLLQIDHRLCSLYQFLYLIPFSYFVLLVYKELSNNKNYLLQIFIFFIALSTPIIQNLATTPLVDLALSFYCTAAILCFLVIREGSNRIIYLGVLLGTALTVKYNALLFIFLFLSYMLFKQFYGDKDTIFKSTKVVVLILLVIIFIFSPFALRSYKYTGNPVYPLFNKLFIQSSSSVKNSDYKLASVGHLEQRFLNYDENYFDVLTYPIKMLIYGKENSAKFFDGVASPLWLMAFLAIVFIKKDKKILTLIVFILLYNYLAYVISPPRLRYNAPIFSLYIVLLGIFMDCIRSPKTKKVIIFSSVIFQLIWMSYHLNQLIAWPAVSQIMSGKMKVSDYLKKNHLEYQLIQDVNKALPKSACVYPIYTSNSLYWYDTCVKFAGYNSGQKLITFIKKSNNASELKSFFANESITYLFVNLNRMKTVIKANLSNEQLMIWNDFVQKYLQVKINKPEFLKRGYVLYEISSS